MTENSSIRHLVIHGRVQGVGFRAWTADEARRHGLAGWVRNRRDGTVEVVLAGPAAHVALMAAACQTGPTSARVTHVDEAEGGADHLRISGSDVDFVELPTI